MLSDVQVVLGEHLERPIHYKEKILDVTLRWGTWEGMVTLKSRKIPFSNRFQTVDTIVIRF